jgi:hypothetical protein
VLCDLQRPPSTLGSGIDKDPADSSPRGPVDQRAPRLAEYKNLFWLLSYRSCSDKRHYSGSGSNREYVYEAQLLVCGGGGSVVDNTGCEIRKGTVG